MYFGDCDSVRNTDYFRSASREFTYDNREIDNARATIGFKYRKKPQWVIDEIIELKAINPHLSVRKIVELFNRLHFEKNQMSVGRTFVGNTLQRNQYEIEVLRKKIKNRRPAKVANNLCWGMDLTYITGYYLKT